MSRSIEEIKEDLVWNDNERRVVRGQLSDEPLNEVLIRKSKDLDSIYVKLANELSLAEHLQKEVVPEPNNINEILEERGKSHGDFENNSLISQRMKFAARDGKSFGELYPFEREALDMIVHKIARIVSGDPHFNDHWDDIAGYATLASKTITKRKSTLNE